MNLEKIYNMTDEEAKAGINISVNKMDFILDLYLMLVMISVGNEEEKIKNLIKLEKELSAFYKFIKVDIIQKIKNKKFIKELYGKQQNEIEDLPELFKDVGK